MDSPYRGGRGHPGRAAARPDRDDRYVVMGSKALERSGHHVLAYDARGHGSPIGRRQPTPTPTRTSARPRRGAGRARHRPRRPRGRFDGRPHALRLALEQPERVAGLVVITPSYDEDDFGDDDSLPAGTRSAEGLRTAGSRASSRPTATPACPRLARDDAAGHPPAAGRARASRGGRRRASARPALAAVRAVDDLAAISVPTVVVADRDEADPATRWRWGRPTRGDPRRAAGRRGAGQVADRLAGRPALAGHRRGDRRGVSGLTAGRAAPSAGYGDPLARSSASSRA